MASSRKNRTLFIDREAVSALSLVKTGLLKPLTSLLNSAQAAKVERTGKIIRNGSGRFNRKISYGYR
jgi:sulfate adenylyltransferase